ncbi:hypothetical protein L6452_13071 [Arctium lappa]|uniref:Uncharacterized protein n=1 Tax=Arctium lappa TaxID=4217 RepID=A0ACB9CH82_ARCLA|nr:hypothetical protein L6452_13071 [Arctium lappa]
MDPFARSVSFFLRSRRMPTEKLSIFLSLFPFVNLKFHNCRICSFICIPSNRRFLQSLDLFFNISVISSPRSGLLSICSL